MAAGKVKLQPGQQQWLLSPCQKGIYYLQQIQPGTRAFNIAAIVHLATTADHTLHPAHIISALRMLVARHDALRATIAHNEDSHNIPTLKCSENLDTYQFATISTATDDPQSWAVNEIRKPFDFSSQLFRFCCLQTAPNKLSLCLSFHHIVVDGSSIRILVTELLRLLTGQTLSPNPPQFTSSLSPLQPQTASSSTSCKTGGGSNEKRERIRQKWMALVGSAKTCMRFERSYAAPDISETVSEWVAVKCAPFLTDIIRDIGKHFGVCPTVVMATMYSLALRTFLQLDSQCMVIGCAFGNRRRSQHGMVGHTVSLLPMQIDFSKSCDLAAVFAQVNEGWCLILEGGVSLFDLLPVLPCLKATSALDRDTTRADRLSPPTGDLARTSPLQTVFSFLSTPQKSFPKSVSLQDGSRVQCSLELPRSCDAHVDLFLEVRSPRNWNGEGSEVSYLFTWEYRMCCLARSDVTYLHNLTISFLHSSMKYCRERSMQNVALGSKGHLKPTTGLPSREKLINSEVVANSYDYTQQFRKITTSKSGSIGDNKTIPGLWVWSSPKVSDTDTSVTPPRLPTLVRPPKNTSVVEGLVLQKSRKLSFIEQFMIKAYEVPEQPAFRSGIRTLTYYETAVMVEKLASVLIEEGVQPGDHVGLVVPHSLMLYISLLATLRCGAAYVPLALHNPQERILTMLELADSKMLVTDVDTLQNTLPGYRGPCVCVDSENVQNFLEMNDDVPKLPQIYYHGNQIAYIIFTSGTTGKPKGVAITNDSLSHFLTNYLLLVTPHDTAVTLTGCTVAWDGHVLDSLGPLLNGSCLVVTATLNICEGITHAFMSPSAASVVNFPHSMRSLVVGGEAFTKTCYENAKRVPKLLTVYGPTETTVFVSADYVIGPDVGRYLANLGTPMPNVTLMVCDSAQKPVALGSEGELCITGPLVSKVGYYKNTEKTKSAFVKSPLSQYNTVYRTGDWTRMLPDGRITFLGRTDDQVKLRGMRFQLLEVENTLRRHSGVRMATAIVRNQGTSSAQLVGYVTPKTVDVKLLFKFLRANLPSYMVPSAVVTLDEMPLKKEGKIDRTALLNLGLPASIDSTDETETCDVNINDQESQSGEELPSLTQTAERLAEIFGRVLEEKSYPPTADFFTSGGQSLLLFRLLQLVKSELKCEVQLVDLLQNPTPLSLARIIVSSPHLPTDTAALESRQRRKSDKLVKSEQCVSNQLLSSTSLRPGTADSAVSENETEIMNRSLEEENLIKSLVDCGLTDITEEESATTSTDSLRDFDYLAPVPNTPLTESLVQSLEELFGSSERSKCRLSVEGLSKQLQAESGFHIPPSSLEKYRDMNTLRTHLKLKALLYYFQFAITPLVQLRPPSSQSDCPLIFLHGGIIGWPLPYLSLARSVDESNIVIQRCEESPTSSFEAMAAYYVEAILTAQPKGPYRLIGVCYGAMLVYEVARQLTDRGEIIQLAVFVNHSPAIEKMPKLFNSDGEPLSNTFVDPVVFFRMILGLPLVIEEQGNMGDGGEEGGEGGVRVGGGDGEKTEVVGSGDGGERVWTKQESKKSLKLEGKVRSLVQRIKSSPDSHWIPFTSSELESVYLGFFSRLRCAWFDYKPRPGADIRQCVLIRDQFHPLFTSFDYSLKNLLPKNSRLSVVTTPKKMGLLSDAETFHFIRTAIILHLHM